MRTIIFFTIIIFVLSCNKTNTQERMYLTGINSNYKAGQLIHFHVWKVDTITQEYSLDFDTFHAELQDTNNMAIDSLLSDGCGNFQIPLDAKSGSYHICVCEVRNGKKIPTTFCDTVVYIESLYAGIGKIYKYVEMMPEFPGGEVELLKYISQNIKYPKIESTDLKTKIYIRFIIDENGKVQNPKVVRGVDPLVDKEALRVIKVLPDFIPGEHQGKKVKVLYTIPIQFEF